MIKIRYRTIIYSIHFVNAQNYQFTTSRITAYVVATEIQSPGYNQICRTVTETLQCTQKNINNLVVPGNFRQAKGSRDMSLIAQIKGVTLGYQVSTRAPGAFDQLDGTGPLLNCDQ